MAVLGTKTYDNLVISFEDTGSGILKSGENRKRGAVLGKITDGGKLVLSDDGADDGSEVPYAILDMDVDATNGDKTVPILLAGKVNEDALIFGGNHTADSTREGMRERNIIYKKTL